MKKTLISHGMGSCLSNCICFRARLTKSEVSVFQAIIVAVINLMNSVDQELGPSTSNLMMDRRDTRGIGTYSSSYHSSTVDNRNRH
jgi:hypothetical protein